MPEPLQISVIVSTYERPQHLKRSLLSLAHQRDVEGKFELIIADDGSQDETADLVHDFERRAPCPVRFVTHQHDGFQLARCRNSGVRLAAAPYILFTDGDCIFPADHLRKHLDAARPGFVRAGDCIRLDQKTSERIDGDAIRSDIFEQHCTLAQAMRMKWLHVKAGMYSTLRHAKKPKLVGNNIGIWKSQLEEVNGFDEGFRGWGCEDDDLAERLRRRDAQIASVIGTTYGYHLWHEPHETAPKKWGDGKNVEYLHRPARLTKCLRGLQRRDVRDLTVSVRSSPRSAVIARRIEGLFSGAAKSPEVELCIAGAGVDRRCNAECRFLVLTENEQGDGLDVSNAISATLRIDGADWEKSLLIQLENSLLGDVPRTTERVLNSRDRSAA